MNRAKAEEGFFEGVGERSLFYRFFRSSEQRDNPSTAVILHGLGEHSGRYGELTQKFLDLSFSVVLLDHRGHGKSTGQRGHIHSFSEYLLDVKALFEKLDLYRPLLLGHSMGGLIALRFAETFPLMISALVLSSPFLGIQVAVPRWKKFLGKVTSRLIPRLSLASELDPYYLTHDTKMIDAYIEDSEVHQKVSTRWFTEALQEIDRAFMEASKITHPFLLQLAGADHICKTEESQRLFGLVESPQKTQKIYPNFFHEIFNEVRREEPFRDLEEWIKELRIKN